MFFFLSKHFNIFTREQVRLKIFSHAAWRLTSVDPNKLQPIESTRDERRSEDLRESNAVIIARRKTAWRENKKKKERNSLRRSSRRVEGLVGFSLDPPDS